VVVDKLEALINESELANLAVARKLRVDLNDHVVVWQSGMLVVPLSNEIDGSTIGALIQAQAATRDDTRSFLEIPTDDPRVVVTAATLA